MRTRSTWGQRSDAAIRRTTPQISNRSRLNRSEVQHSDSGVQQRRFNLSKRRNVGVAAPNVLASNHVLHRVRSSCFRRPRLILAGGLLGVGAVLAATFVTAAFAASGGPNPSQAPGLALGSHAFSSCNGIDREWWAIPGLINDDQVVLDINGSSNENFSIYPPSADDYNWRNVQELDVKQENGTDHERITFTASESGGRYLIDVYCYSNTAYDFTVSSIRHTIRVDLVPKPVSLPYRGTLRLNVINGAGGGWDGGAPITLYGAWAGKGHPLGQAVAANGVATVPYRLPSSLRGKRITIWAVAPATENSTGDTSSRASVRIR